MPTPLFPTITAADWRETFRDNRNRPNKLLESIHERIAIISANNPALQRELQDSIARYRHQQEATARSHRSLRPSNPDAGLVTEDQGEP